MNKKTQKATRKSSVISLIVGFGLIFLGIYGVFVSLTGGMEYINSPDIRTINAEVISVKHTYEKDDDGDITREKWTATLSYTIDGKEYTTKRTYSTKTYSGETVQIEVYKTSKGEYKVSSTNPFGVVLSISALIFGSTTLSTRRKNLSGKRSCSKEKSDDKLS